MRIIPGSGRRSGSDKNALRRAVCIISAAAVLLSSGCFKPPIDLASYNLRTVAVVIAEPSAEKQLKGVPDGKGEGASRSAGSAVGSLWKGCGKILNGAVTARELGIVVFAGTLAVCIGLSPVVGTSAALVGAYKADSKADVDRIKRAVQEIALDPREADFVFEQAILDSSGRNEGRAFRKGIEYGLYEIRPDADYRPAAEKGVDAVLEVGGLIVALNGKDLHSPFFLEVCTPVRLISTRDNALLFEGTQCRTSESRDLDSWSAEHWSSLKTETFAGMKELGGQYLYRMVFR